MNFPEGDERVLGDLRETVRAYGAASLTETLRFLNRGFTKARRE
jgi:hypothetical protein